jgi:sugar O-acyltransferase (sialic acid O-acetyltransferase NeuD family)
MSKKRLLIIGASGHGKVVGDCAHAYGQWSEFVYFDDRWPALKGCGPWSVVGGGNSLIKEVRPGDQVFAAIGHTPSRLAWLRRFELGGLSIATIIHPRSILSPDVTIGFGSLVVAGAVINIGARLGIGCIVNTGATVDHDCLLGDGVHICPGAHLAGDVRVGDGAWIGIGVSVKQGLCIGSNATVGAGAVVLANVTDGVTVIGVPARPCSDQNL